MSDVFISHVEEDADIALGIALGLEEAGYTTWCYEVDSIPGPSYLIQTGQAIEQSKAVILVISPHSLGSRQITKEVVRASESNKEFIPVRRDITHVEFQNRQPEWRQAVGAAASIGIPRQGVAGVLPRIIDGIKSLGIHPRLKTDTGRIVQIRKAIGELQGRSMLEKAEEPPVPTKKSELEYGVEEIPEEKVKPAVSVERPTEAVKVVIKPAWSWVGIALLSIALGLLAWGTVDALLVSPNLDFYLGMLIFVLPFMISGIYCLRRGMARDTLTKSAEGRIPNWWWLLPVALGFIGGIISWIKQKDVNWRQAMNMLTLGIILTPIWTIPFFMFHAPVTPSTPPEAPVANFSAIPTSGLAPLDVTFIDESTGDPASWSWDFPGGSPSSASTQGPHTVTYSAAGNYTVNLTVENARGNDTETKTRYINVAEAPIPAGQLIYEDDFSNPNSGWARSSRVNMEYEYKDGEYYILVKKFDWSAWDDNPNAGQFTDFALEIDARLASGPNDSTRYGLIFRFQDHDNFYQFLVSGDGYYRIDKMLNNVWIDLQSWTKSAFINEGNSTNHLKVVCQGSQIEVYVNEHYLTTVTDNSFAEGSVGMIVDSSQPNGSAAFDNIRVYSAPEAPIPAGQLIYEDDFSNPNSGWPADPAAEDCVGDYEDGEYHGIVKKSDWGCWAVNLNAGQFTDFALEIDARAISGPSDGAYGLVFRFQDDDNFYQFLVSGDRHYVIERQLNGVWTTLRSGTKSAFINEGNSTNHLKVVCQGSQIEVYVNGYQLTTVTDNSFAVGYMGIGGYTSQPNGSAAFDNITIYSLD